MDDKRYRVGIVGASWITSAAPQGPPPAPFGDDLGQSHVSGLSLMHNVELVAICDLLPGLLEEFQQAWGDRWPDTTLYTDYREMLDRENLDILAVATPDNLHAEITVAGARSGVKGIFCEKPLATTLEEADRMIRACQEGGVALSVNHSRRWSPIYHEAREMVRKGAIGPLATVAVTMGGQRAMLFRNGTHLIDLVGFFAESTPVRVSARLEDGFEDWDVYKGDGGRDPARDPAATGTVLFANGVQGRYSGNKRAFNRFWLELSGADGSIDIDLNGPSAHLVTRDAGSGDLVRRELRPRNFMAQGFVAAYRDLIGLIERGGTGVSTAQDARQTLQIMLGFLRSNQEGSRLVELPGG